jgi:UDP-perosamine 4-acetyltransferase
MNPCIVIGAGGHSRSLCSLLKSSKEYKPLMVIDLHYSGKNEDILGLKVEGVKDVLSQDLRKTGVKHLFLAIGDNRKREELFLDLKNQGFMFPNLIAGTAVEKEDVVYGEGNIVFDKAYIGPLVRMGNNNIINTASIIEHECSIENHCNIGPGSVVSGRSKMGNHVFVGSSAVIIDRVSISSYVTLGAGTVVVKDIKEPGTYIGVPAKTIKGD